MAAAPTEIAIHKRKGDGSAKRMGFFTDTTTCIGCKACEVACKQWNDLPADDLRFGKGFSYDYTNALSASTWRHVRFVETVKPTTPPEQISSTEDLPDLVELAAGNLASAPLGGDAGDSATQLDRWVFMSDVCKHCTNAGCLDACPTGALIRTEFETVIVQPDICNGCGYCVPSCPFGVIDRDPYDGRAAKCTLCYDRLEDGLEPACAKACPTDSIQFGPIDELRQRARGRVATLQERGVASAYVYGDRTVGGTGGIDGLNAFFVLTAPPEVYNLPRAPELPQRKTLPAFLATAGAAVALGVAAYLSLRERR